MKLLVNWFVRIFVFILVVAGVLFLTRNVLVKTALEQSMELVAGVDMSIRKVNIDVFKSSVNLKGIRVFNPEGFSDDVMVDIPEIFIDADPGKIAKGVIGFHEVRFHLKEFNVVKKSDGTLNLNTLKPLQEKEQEAAKEEKSQEVSDQAPPEFFIERFHLRVDEVRYIAVNRAGEESLKRFPIRLREEFNDVDDPNKIVQIITYKALLNTTVAQLTGFDLTGLGGSLGSTVTGAMNAITGAMDTTSSAGSKAVEKATGLFKGLTDTLKSIK